LEDAGIDGRIMLRSEGPVICLCTASFKIRRSYVLPTESIHMFWVISGQTAIVFLYRLIFITEMGRVYCAVRTECLYIMEAYLAIERVNVSLGTTGLYEICVSPC